MANQRIEMPNLRHILRLKTQGHSNRKVARMLGLARQTVNDYVLLFQQSGKSFDQLYQLSDAELASLLTSPVPPASERYEHLQGQLEFYAKELKRPGATYQNLWAEYIEAFPGGYSYNQFRHHVRTHVQTQEVSLRQNHRYGDKMFVDYCGKKLHLTDPATGELIPVEVFAATLGGSQLLYVEATRSQQLEDFLDSNQNALAYFQGVPAAIVPDNLKSAVTRAHRYEPKVNRHFQAFALHYNTTILPARAYKPKDKALVEGSVKLTYQHIYFPLRNQTFFTLQDLNQAIRALLDKFNLRPFQAQSYSRQSLFEQYEKAQLRPLPAERFYMRTYARATVRKDVHIWFNPDKHYYSVPHRFLDKQVQVQATHHVVEIYHQHERIALHRRCSDRPGACSTQQSHLPTHLQHLRDRNPDYFDQKAREFGPHVQHFFQEVFKTKNHPEQAMRICTGILSLRKTYDPQRIGRACQRAAFFKNYSYSAVRNILKKGLDHLPWDAGPDTNAEPIMTEDDPNIRGAQYFS